MPTQIPSPVPAYLRDLETLSGLPVSAKYRKLILPEYPFDHQLLSLSRIYRASRQSFLEIGGHFAPRLSSTMRSLSAHDLFGDEVQYSPAFSEMLWFKDHPHDVTDPEAQIEALQRFSDISIFHEQNHRVLWRLLPPAPKVDRDLCRYLNFAESLVVALDLAMADELGKKLSSAFERMKVIYRDGGVDQWFAAGREEYRQYLLAVVCATYFQLELVHDDDVLKAVRYVVPAPPAVTRAAVRRAMGLNQLFTRVTNPEWQTRNLKTSLARLSKLHRGSEFEPLYLPEDPLDLEEELVIARAVFDFYGL